MKVFSKFLAVTLALFMVLALIPFSVFAKASEPWLEVEGNEGVDAPVLTVKVDAKALMDLLRADGSDSLLDTLQSGISLDLESLTEVFTATELFEIVPREEWLKILPVEDFVESVGVEEVRAALDLETLAPVIDWDTVLDLVGGDVEKAKEYISVENGVLVVENLEKLFDDIGFSEVLSVAPVETLAEQLSADELFDLVTKIDLKPYAKQLLALVLRKTLSNVDELVIDGTLVAAEDNKGMLEVYASNLLSVINKIRPSLDDIANTLSMNAYKLKLYAASAKKLGRARCEAMLAELARVDTSSKFGGISGYTAIELFIMQNM